MNEDLQLGSLLLEVREFVAGRSRDSLVVGFKAFSSISKKSLEMHKLLVVAPVFLVLLVQGVLSTEVPSAARTLSWRVRNRLGWNIRRGTWRGSGNITGTSVRVGFMLGR